MMYTSNVLRKRRQDEFFVPHPHHKKLVVYGIPMLCLAVGLTLHGLLLKPLGIPPPLPFLVLPIVLAAIYFGLGSALLMTMLGGLALGFFVIDSWEFAASAWWQIGGFSIIGVTIGLLGAINKKIQAKLEKSAQVENARRDDFLAMLGHELRNPLASISMAARLLDQPMLDSRGATEIIYRQVAHMTHLVSDLLDVSRVKRGLVVLEKAAVDLTEAVKTASEQVHGLVERRQHRLILNLPTAPLWVLGDKARLVQVIANLLENAVRYTKPNGVLTLTLNAEHDQVHLSVQDNGIGIAPELADRVFEMFVQAKRSSDGVMGGLGLGLALVKSMVEAHTGTVTVYSAGLNCGSTFLVQLPLLSAEKMKHMKHMKAEAEAEASCAKKPLNLLLIEDNLDAAQPLAMMLMFEGYRVTTVTNGQAALQQAEQKMFDVAIVDIGLPDMDGYTLARHFRSIPHQASTRLIAVTGHGSPNDIARARDAGFDKHIAKPIDYDLLCKELGHGHPPPGQLFSSSPKAILRGDCSASNNGPEDNIQEGREARRIRVRSD